MPVWHEYKKRGHSRLTFKVQEEIRCVCHQGTAKSLYLLAGTVCQMNAKDKPLAWEFRAQSQLVGFQVVQDIHDGMQVTKSKNEGNKEQMP